MPEQNLTTLATLIGDDSHAASFQSMGQYRSALLKEIAQGSAAPEQEAVAVMYEDGTILSKAECGTAFDVCCRAKTPLYTHADPSEVERLRAENKRLESAWQVDAMRRKDDLIAAQERENDLVKKELAEAQVLLRDWLDTPLGVSSPAINRLRCKTDYMFAAAQHSEVKS